MRAYDILENIKREVSKLPTENEKQFATHILAYKAILEKLDEILDSQSSQHKEEE